MATGKVEICGVDTATLPVLTNERMRELLPLVHSGDRAAREEFIRGNLRLRFFEGRTQMKVAGEIGIPQAQVSRLEKNALLHMRKYVSGQ